MSGEVKGQPFQYIRYLLNKNISIYLCDVWPFFSLFLLTEIREIFLELFISHSPF